MQILRSKIKPYLLAGALACLCAAGAQAQTTLQLRFLGLDTSNVFQVTNVQSSQGEDRFNNGNPLSGAQYQGYYNGGLNGAAQVGTYAATGTFAPGRELTGAASDFVGNASGVGSLAFAASDAAVNTSNLTPAGYASSVVALRPVNSAGNAIGLVGRSQGFDFTTVWNYSSLQPGEVLFHSLAGSGGTNYVDRLQIRSGKAVDTGLAFINFETQSSNAGVLTRTLLGSVTPSGIYANLAAVDYLGLNLSRDMPTTANPNPGVKASIVFFDAALNGTGNLTRLADYSFSTLGQTFQGAGDFQSVFAAATWLAPVPEPTPVVLLLFGLAVLALSRRAGRFGGGNAHGLKAG